MRLPKRTERSRRFLRRNSSSACNKWRNGADVGFNIDNYPRAFLPPVQNRPRNDGPGSLARLGAIFQLRFARGAGVMNFVTEKTSRIDRDNSRRSESAKISCAQSRALSFPVPRATS